MSSKERTLEILRELQTSATRLSIAAGSRRRDAAEITPRDVDRTLYGLRNAANKLALAERAVHAGTKSSLSDESVLQALSLCRDVDAVVRKTAGGRLISLSELIAISSAFLKDLPHEATDISRGTDFDDALRESVPEEFAEEESTLPGDPTTPLDDDVDEDTE